jgi:hypothetical protein
VTLIIYRKSECLLYKLREKLHTENIQLCYANPKFFITPRNKISYETVSPNHTRDFCDSWLNLTLCRLRVKRRTFFNFKKALSIYANGIKNVPVRS